MIWAYLMIVRLECYQNEVIVSSLLLKPHYNITINVLSAHTYEIQRNIHKKFQYKIITEIFGRSRNV